MTNPTPAQLCGLVLLETIIKAKSCQTNYNIIRSIQLPQYNFTVSSVVVGLHPFNSSPSKLDVAPASWGEWAGHVFVAEFGDLAPGTNPLRSQPAGYRVVRIDPATNQVEPFIGNRQAGPASEQGAKGRGIERPFDPKFGPDGALYLVDYGVFKLDPSQTPPFRSEPGTGSIWKVTRTEE